MTFDAAILSRLRDAREVAIETTSPAGVIHQAVIWIVGDEREPTFVPCEGSAVAGIGSSATSRRARCGWARTAFPFARSRPSIRARSSS